MSYNALRPMEHILDLLLEGAITLEDLSEFSEDLQERMAWIMKRSERQNE